MPITFKQLHPHFAAEVRDFDMNQPIDAATARMFERADLLELLGAGGDDPGASS